MRNAPSVNFPVGRCAFYGRLLLGLGVLCLSGAIFGVVAAQRSQDTGGAWLAWVGLLGSVLWAVWATWSWRQSPRGQLHWDAQAAPLLPTQSAGAWMWREPGDSHGVGLRRVQTMWDVQTRMFLRLDQGDKSLWVWVERTRDPARWDDLRRALRAHA